MPAAARPRIGRPREFDVDVALEQAMRVFWAQGYEGASLADLTQAMGITRTSLYAAFGSKEELFRRALERYSAGPAAYGERALEERTAHAVAQAFLRGAAETTTQPGAPAGCLGVQGALATGSADRTVRDALAQWRDDAHQRLRGRFLRAIEEGDLPSDADPDLLARYLVTVGNGIAVQAAGGVARPDLQRVADAALRGWPMA
jgi:AcrR family transcriptional regulator